MTRFRVSGMPLAREEQIRELKVADGGDIMTFGSPTLVQSLTNVGLVDEYRILIHPVIVNEGKCLFDNLERRTDFRLISVDTFERGAILANTRQLRPNWPPASEGVFETTLLRRQK